MKVDIHENNGKLKVAIDVKYDHTQKGGAPRVVINGTKILDILTEKGYNMKKWKCIESGAGFVNSWDERFEINTWVFEKISTSQLGTNDTTQHRTSRKNRRSK